MTGILIIKRIFIIAVLVNIGPFISGQVCYGQENSKNKASYKESESFAKLQNGEIKSEIASFNIKASVCLENIPIIEVEEIPLKHCTDSSAYFEKGNIRGAECVVSILASNSCSKSRVIRMFYSMYSYAYNFPDSAINDIYNPKFCTEYTRKNKPVSSNCKVFQTENRKRIYIYMLYGEGENQYEITWVYQDNDYYTRVIDCL